MTRNWLSITDKYGRVHILNATDIIDIFDEKNFGYLTIFCVDSRKIDISYETYTALLTVLKPSQVVVNNTEQKEN